MVTVDGIVLRNILIEMNLEPLKLFGEGEYALTSVKQIKVTNDYLKLKNKKCQGKESYEECTTRSFLRRVEQECNCLPYRLRNFADKNQV